VVLKEHVVAYIQLVHKLVLVGLIKIIGRDSSEQFAVESDCSICSLHRITCSLFQIQVLLLSQLIHKVCICYSRLNVFWNAIDKGSAKEKNRT